MDYQARQATFQIECFANAGLKRSRRKRRKQFEEIPSGDRESHDVCLVTNGAEEPFLPGDLDYVQQLLLGE